MSKKTTTKHSSEKIKVTQIKSAIGRDDSQRRTLIGLGLNKLQRSKVLENTSSIWGMINKVKHLVKVETD
jgi:large subunit ribosomal protein L30